MQFHSNLLDGDYGSFALESLSETKSKISLDCVSERDAGMYECVAETSSGRKTSVGTEVHVVSEYLIFFGDNLICTTVLPYCTPLHF